MALTITDANFSEFLASDKPLVVDFWATWCGPCKMMGPIVESLAEKFDGQVNIGKLNVDENDETCDAFGIRSIPTLIFFKNGEVVDRVVGVIPQNELEARIQKLI